MLLVTMSRLISNNELGLKYNAFPFPFGNFLNIIGKKYIYDEMISLENLGFQTCLLKQCSCVKNELTLVYK